MPFFLPLLHSVHRREDDGILLSALLWSCAHCIIKSGAEKTAFGRGRLILYWLEGIYLFDLFFSFMQGVPRKILILIWNRTKPRADPWVARPNLCDYCGYLGYKSSPDTGSQSGRKQRDAGICWASGPWHLLLLYQAMWETQSGMQDVEGDTVKSLAAETTVILSLDEEWCWRPSEGPLFKILNRIHFWAKLPLHLVQVLFPSVPLGLPFASETGYAQSLSCPFLALDCLRLLLVSFRVSLVRLLRPLGKFLLISLIWSRPRWRSRPTQWVQCFSLPLLIILCPWLLLFSPSVVPNSLWPHGLQHVRLPWLHHLLELARTMSI